MITHSSASSDQLGEWSLTSPRSLVAGEAGRENSDSGKDVIEHVTEDCRDSVSDVQSGKSNGHRGEVEGTGDLSFNVTVAAAQNSSPKSLPSDENSPGISGTSSPTPILISNAAKFEQFHAGAPPWSSSSTRFSFNNDAARDAEQDLTTIAGETPATLFLELAKLTFPKLPCPTVSPRTQSMEKDGFVKPKP
nr:hypothetical protein KK1_032899 [Ipomoea batatas]